MRVLTLMCIIAAVGSATASVALPGIGSTSLSSLSARPCYRDSDSSAFEQARYNRNLAFNRNRSQLAMAIPGYGIAEQVLVGGFGNFLQAYNFVITGRVLLSWFPQAQSIGALQPVFAITDPYLNLFRGLIPPIFGLDLSPILAFVTLNVLTSATASIGQEIPEEMKENMKKTNAKFVNSRL